MDMLVQLRWQLVRSLEFSQGVETENISLRRMLLEKERLLKEKDKQLVNATNNRAKDELYKANLEKIFKWVHLLKEFQSNMKANYSYEKGLMDDAFTSTKREMEGVMRSCNERTSEDAVKMAMLQKQYEDAILRLDDAQELTSGRAGEIEKLRMTVLSLNDRMSSLDREVERLQTERASSDERYQALCNERDSLNTKYDLLHTEQKRLQLLLVKAESDSIRRESEHNENTTKLKIYYETVITSLHATNGSLNDTIADLQNQIDKLTFSLLGKSNRNFAKFVELKNENVHLQKTLNNVINTAKVKGSAGSVGIEGVTGAPSKSSGRIPIQSNQTINTANNEILSIIGNISARSTNGNSEVSSDFASFEADRSKGSSNINSARSGRYKAGDNGSSVGQKINLSLNIPAPPSLIYAQGEESPQSTHSKAFGGPSPRQDSVSSSSIDAGGSSSSKISIGVPLLNKQAREALKGRVVI